MACLIKKLFRRLARRTNDYHMAADFDIGFTSKQDSRNSNAASYESEPPRTTE
jgi:hypothetical protein